MLRPRLFSLSASITTAVAVVTCIPAAASAEDKPGDIDVGGCGMWVCEGVEVPGDQPSNSGESHVDEPASSGGNATGCAAGAEKDPASGLPCYYPGAGTLDPATRCYYKIADPKPPKSDPVWQGHEPGDGDIYLRSCTPGSVAGPADGYVWLATPPAGLAAGPTPEELAQRALNRMRLDGADIGSAPPAGSKGLIGMPVWLWTQKSPNTWGPISMTASAGGLSVTATARVQHVKWSMGDGRTVTCTTAGTPYKKSYGKKDSPDCGYRYTKVPKGGRYTITATSTWVVEWEASTGETGVLPDEIRTAQTTARVGELQVVN